ncbi:sporulation protein YlmC with PRC-barrel domain [Microvirga flocculans]|uniref:Sporulation protein YlmC with PRC-barrel domain n=2 Tax=Microvirga flocculans TaxID=217168 RepID=A0A7W6IHL2_9HYPH|nr:PRC-barrel domain-containing protein [Microvirga flocculans]MBB4041484.1 sporulation protein YlmC with PRC-barrel domain [Microvirga flocculans]
MTKMDADQMMASDLIGTRVISANNESIGDINDVILGRDGRVMAAVVGVGGFLGIGEKDVAVPFSALEFLTDQQVQAMNNGNKGNVATTGSTATGSSSSMTGNTASTGTNTMSSDNDRNEPERVMLRMTKAELQAAPAFDEDGDDNNRSTTGTTGVTSPAPAGTTTAPKK